MAHIVVGPVGRIAKGNVMDVSVKPFERALKDHDPQLYVKWNANKLRGHGCWEIRRTPNLPIAVPYGEVDGREFYRLEYIELDIIAHVLDCAYLNYDQLRKIKEMDTWKNKNWVADMEYKEKVRRADLQDKAYKDMLYYMKQNKSAIRDYQSLVNSGLNPAELFRYWK